MALVMLPCDLPWWNTVHKKLASVQECTELDAMIEHMQKIHDLCNVSLDPDDDDRTENVYAGLLAYVQQMPDSARQHFVGVTMLNIARRAQSLKAHRPPRGLEFSLQQQTDSVEISYSLMAALLANAIFSTFPKRTQKTHPTLQDFNFSNFFKHLDQPIQQAKLQSIITYFDWIELPENLNGCVTISRQVMSGKQWLTIEDWFDCEQPLCPLDIRHSGRIERTKPDFIQTVFVSCKLGARVLYDGESQECLHFSIFPEILPVLLHVEALEDNESILIEDARQIGQIMVEATKPAKMEPISEHRKVSLLLMDAEDYTDYPINQLEEDNILRELNKCLLSFSQKSTSDILELRSKQQQRIKDSSAGRHRALLSPIGEYPTVITPSPPPSPDAAAPSAVTTIVVRQASSSTKRSSFDSEKIRNDIAGRRAWLTPERSLYDNDNNGSTGPLMTVHRGRGMMNGRRGRFIVLGSSGECLPVSRHHAMDSSGSFYSSCDEMDELEATDDDGDDDGDEVFLSARESLETEVGSDKYPTKSLAQHYACELEKLESRLTFATKLKAALSQSTTGSSSCSYSAENECNSIKDNRNASKMRRTLSTGFVLQEDSLDDEFYNELQSSSDEQHQMLVDKYGAKLNGTALKMNSSSSYSFSTDNSSELDDIYEEFSRWIDSDEANESGNKLERRDEAIALFASSLLKRTLSESFVGVEMTEGGTIALPAGGQDRMMEDLATRRIRLILSSRSLSLELEKQKHRITQLRNQSSTVEAPPPTTTTSSSNKLSSTTQTIMSPPTHHNTINHHNHNHNHSNGKSRAGKPRRSLRWSIAPVNSQQTVNCDDVTFKIQLNDPTTQRLDVRPVSTGNWGCGRTLNGEVQLKLIIQWLAASMAGLPCLMYYTAEHPKLAKLDTVSRVLRDRRWTVGALATATLAIAQSVLDSPTRDPDRKTDCFFEKFIGTA